MDKKQDLISRFETGDKPSGKDFEELINSCFNDKDLIDSVESISEKLNKKVWNFSNVESMKNFKHLETGDLVVTSGFYSENDGGGCTYQIGNFSNTDGFFEHALSNGKKARIIIENNQVNIRQIGGRPQSKNGEKYDNKLYVQAYINRLDVEILRFKLYIPSGIWCFSPTVLARQKGYAIIGDTGFGHHSLSCEGTIINALNDKQELVWRIGSGNGNTYNHELGPFTFSSADYRFDAAANRFRTNSVYDVESSLVYVDGAHNITWHKLFFMNTLGTSLRIRSSWEHTFEDIVARSVGNWNKPTIHFDNVNTNVNVGGNISAMYFNKIDVENYSGHVIKWERNCSYANNKINTLILEASTFNPGTYDSVSRNFADGIYNEDTAIKQAILKIEGGISGCNIESILINNIGYEYAKKNNDLYVVDRLIDTNGIDKKLLNLTIGGIYVSGSFKKWDIVHHSVLNQSPLVDSKLNILHYSSTRNREDSEGILNVVNFPAINFSRTDSLLDKQVFGYHLAPNMVPIHKIQYIPIQLYNSDGSSISKPSLPARLYTDQNSINNEKLVLRNYTGRSESEREKYLFSFVNDKSKNPKIRFRNSSGTTIYSEGLVDGVLTINAKSIQHSADYIWTNIFNVENNPFDDGTQIKVYTLTTNFLWLDVLKYE